MLNRSTLFTAYNAAKPIYTDRQRLNRALGVAQRRTAPAYITTLQRCSCPDFSGVAPNGRRFRLPAFRPCKHIIALALQQAAA